MAIMDNAILCKIKFSLSKLADDRRSCVPLYTQNENHPKQKRLFPMLLIFFLLVVYFALFNKK